MSLPFTGPTLATINTLIRERYDPKFRIRSVRRPRQPAGRHSSSGLVVSDGSTRYFLKVQSAAHAPAFTAEVAGLNVLREAEISAPMAIGCGATDSESFIVLEYLRLRPPRDGDYIGLALLLATMHEQGQGEARFGWTETNFIGPTPQWNGRAESWIGFWRDARLAPQLALAARNGYGGLLQSLGERVIDRLDKLLAGHRPTPALLHGNLWHGNTGFLANGKAVVFDPAVYLGDREADIAMTELFGGFPKIFYDTYFERLPVDAAYPVRRDLYNLYHVLNHLNLFGDQYRIKAEGLMRDLLARSD